MSAQRNRTGEHPRARETSQRVNSLSSHPRLLPSRVSNGRCWPRERARTRPLQHIEPPPMPLPGRPGNASIFSVRKRRRRRLHPNVALNDDRHVNHAAAEIDQPDARHGAAIPAGRRITQRRQADPLTPDPLANARSATGQRISLAKSIPADQSSRPGRPTQPLNIRQSVPPSRRTSQRDQWNAAAAGPRPIILPEAVPARRDPGPTRTLGWSQIFHRQTIGCGVWRVTAGFVVGRWPRLASRLARGKW